MLQAVTFILQKSNCGISAKRLIQKANVVTVSKTKDHGIFPYEKIPGPPSIPLLKSSWMFLPIVGGHETSKLHKYFDTLLNNYGPIVRVDFPMLRTVWLFDPEDFKTVYHNEGKYPEHPGIIPLKIYRESQSKLYNFGGITAVHGEEWYELRSKIQRHLLHIPIVESYGGKMNEMVNDFIEYIHHVSKTKGKVENFLHLLQTFAIETVCYIILNVKLNTLQHGTDFNSKAAKMKNAATEVFSALGRTALGTQMWRFYSNKDWRDLVNSHDTFTDISLQYIQQVLNNSNETSSEDDMTLLETLLKRKGMKPEHAVIMMMDLLLGGVDTSSNTAGFLFHNLAVCPEAQEKLHKEVCSVMHSKNTDVTVDDLHEMEYLKSCVKETLRFTPIVMGVARSLDKEIILKNYRIPPKTILMLATMSVMRQEKYFTKANTFWPERWLSSVKNHPYAFIPFGHGPRSCIGRRVALQELHLLLAKIIQEFHIECEDKKLGMITGLTTRPDRPLNFIFTPRN